MRHLFILHVLWTTLISGQLDLSDVQLDPYIPADVSKCVDTMLTKTANETADTAALTTEEEVHVYCMRNFLWRTDRIDWNEFNITKTSMDKINSYLDSMMVHSRGKRQAGTTFPPTGFRVRREYRRLRPFERRAFHLAVRALKASGVYDDFANLHRGIVTTSAHEGPNFLGWHRVYITMFEEALRRVNRAVTLPYWDSSMDFDMANPADSIIWSPNFLGNGDGFVTTGPFANWRAPVDRLTRNVGGRSRLISKEVIARIMTRCRTSEIVPPTAAAQFDLELAHGGPHLYVGGQMSGLNTAAHDPVFFLHHAFIDYIWELFRIRQIFVCRVNPERDYPPTAGLHGPARPMDGFPRYRNIDGYRNYWPRFWFRYERSPSCSRFRPTCGSPFLRCDAMRGRCVSVARPMMAAAGAAGAAGAAFDFNVIGQNFATRGMAASNSATMARAAREESTIAVGPTFRAPPSDGRTFDSMASMNAPMGFGMGPMRPRRMRGPRRGFRRFRRSVAGNDTEYSVPNAQDNSSRYGPTFRAPPDEYRPMAEPDITVQQVARQFQQFSANDLFSIPLPLLPSVDFSVVNNSEADVATTGQSSNDVTLNTFIPVQVIYIRTQGYTVQPITNAKYTMLSNSTNQESSLFNDCRPHPSGAAKIVLQSNGINTMGLYSSRVEVDTRVPVSTGSTFIQVNSPTNGLTIVMLSAFHECGLMCQPTCAIAGTNPTRYRACTGILKIQKGDQSLMYGTTVEAALDNMSQVSRLMGIQWNKSPKMHFHCSNADVTAWSQASYSPVWTE